MTIVYVALATSVVLNIVLLLLLKSSYLDYQLLTDLINSLEEELNEEEMKNEK